MGPTAWLLLLSFLACGLPLPIYAQSEWLPANVAEGLAEQVADGMEAIDPSVDRERMLQGGRRVVELVRTRLESWGEKEVLARAPRYPKLAMPSSTQPHIDAINRYQLCNVILLTQQADRSDPTLQRTGVLGIAATTSAILFLHKPFFDAGGKRPQVEAFLTSPAMEAVFEALQTDKEAADHVAEQCTPVVVALLSPPED